MVELSLIVIAIGIILLSFGLAYWIVSAHGQETDPNAYCLYKFHPYIQLCEQQKMDKILEFAVNQSLEEAIEEEKEAARQWEDLQKFK